MHLEISTRRAGALTFIEVVVVIVGIAFLSVILLAALAPTKKRCCKINCTNNLKQITLAFRIWEGDNGDKYPTQVSSAEGGAREWIAAGNVAAGFQVMSNELSTPKIVFCPDDKLHHMATNFLTHFGNGNVSYLVGMDAADQFPESILTGDDNFELKGLAVKSGVLELSRDTPLAWTGERHRFSGNVGLAFGSVETTANAGLREALVNQYKFSTGFTNRFRFAIP